MLINYLLIAGICISLVFIVIFIKKKLIGANIMEDVSDLYKSSAELFHKFYKSLGNYQLDEKLDIPEVYLVTSLKLSHHYVNSISILLRKKLHISGIIISRSIIELAFSLRWAFEPEEREKVIERILRLEADPFHHIDKEISRIENSIEEGKTDWKSESVVPLREQMERFKQEFDKLLEIDSEGDKKFKKAVNVADMMSDLRIKYYHLYVHTSSITHPNPNLRDLIDTNSEKYEVLMEGIRMTLSYCLYLLYVIMHTGLSNLDQINPENQEIRKEYCDELLELVNKSNKNYFGIKMQNI